ncbi:fimbrial assembly protein [Dyella terrae]|uniref:Fimbrial assembly protein n=2 Tax=Dyella TaxID=231454 RepID=A0A4V2NLF7_9GAMM|nr:fimbrial assembly protein [Dyella terrae]TCI08734.1 fimbrial assembly protein [Dyella soli]
MRRAWRASPLPRFLGWWGQELAAMLPDRWRHALQSGAIWFLIEPTPGGWQVRRSGHAEVLARWSDEGDATVQQVALNDALRGVDREDLRLALCLPAGMVLRRSLSLPMAARDTLHRVGAFEMDRQTPFRIDQVRYDIRELDFPPSGGRLMAELVVVTRAVLDPLLARLEHLGIAVDAVDVADGVTRHGTNLLPPELAPRRANPRRRINLILATACVLLVGLVLAQWLHNRREVLAQMQSQVETLRGEAQQVAALRQQLQDNAGAAGFLAARKRNTVSALAVMKDISERLPTSAWLERLSIDNTGQIGFQGQSPQAARLVDALKGSQVITDVNFQGTIQADPSTGKERFYLVARMRKPDAGRVEPAPAASARGAP